MKGDFMGSAPKKIKKALIDKPINFVEKGVKKVGEELLDTTLGIDKRDRRGTPDEPTASKSPAPSKVETNPAKKAAQGGLSNAEQRRLIEKNKQFKQQQI